MAWIEREIEIEPKRDGSIGGRLASECNRQAVEPADVRDFRASAMALCVVGKIALPIDPVGSRPIGGQFRGSEARGGGHVEAGLGAESHIADMACADEPHVELTRWLRSRCQILLLVADCRRQIEAVEICRKPSRSLDLRRGFALLGHVHFGMRRKDCPTDPDRCVNRNAPLANALFSTAAQMKIICEKSFSANVD